MFDVVTKKQTKNNDIYLRHDGDTNKFISGKQNGEFLSHHGSEFDAHMLARRIADDVRAQGDCPLSTWAQFKRTSSEKLRSFIH